MEIKRVSTQPSGRGRQSGSLARCGSIRFFRHPIRHGLRTPAERLSPARGPHGTPIRSARLSSSPLGVAGHSARAARSRKFGRATWSGFRPARST